MTQESMFFERPMPGGTMQYESKDITFFRHKGNKFSSEANKSIKNDKSRIRHMVLSAIKNTGPSGLTSEECEQRLGVAHTTVSARISELKALGLIKDSGYRRKTRSGRNASVVVSREY